MQYLSESIDLPVSEETAFNVLSDLDKILRLSPYWSLKALKPFSTGDIREGGKYEATIEYYGRELTETHGLEVIEFLKNRRISLKAGNGLLKEIRFALEKKNAGIRLTQQFLLQSEDGPLLQGTQRELSVWLRSIGEYIKLAGGKTLWKRFLKWFMDRVWLKLTLSERKIAGIITKISIIEILLLLLLVILWNLFVNY